MGIIWAMIKLAFFSLFGMFIADLLTGHWWTFWLVVAVMAVASYVKRSVERKRRHERVRAAIQQRVRELEHEYVEEDNIVDLVIFW